MMGREINPERLKKFRGKKRWSQKQLAAAIGETVPVSTISRWERGEVRRLRAASLEKLCIALGVTEDQLCGEGPLPPEPERKTAESDSQITLKIDGACRNALALTARRYGIQQRHIVEMAPFLLFLLAEKSLEERRSQLEQDLDALDRLSGLSELVPHSQELSGNMEEKSIKGWDIFARYELDSLNDPESENQFLKFIKPPPIDSKPVNKPIRWDGRSSPFYEICREQALEIAGEDCEAAEFILEGRVLLSSMPVEIRKSPPETRAQWIKAQPGKSEEVAPHADEDFDEYIGRVAEHINRADQERREEERDDPSHPEYFGGEDA